MPVAGYRTMGPPVAGATEACFEHELVAEPDGRVPSALVNRGLGVGMSLVSRLEQLPFLTVWRMLGEGDYGVALEPSTNRDAGRWDARERGELTILAPGEVRRYDLSFGGLIGQDAIEGFESRVAPLGGDPA